MAFEILPLDIKILIAAVSEDAWYWLYQLDAAFANYSRNAGRLHFANLFAKCIKIDHTTTWTLLGRVHREGGPAITINQDSCVEFGWFRADRRHREDGPALERYHRGKLSDQLYYIDGQLHHETEPAYIHYDDEKISYQAYYIHGKCHRDDGPAVMFNDVQIWFQHGKQHREDGPAWIGPYCVMYMQHGKCIERIVIEC